MPAATAPLSRGEVEKRVDDLFDIVGGIIGSGQDLQAAGDVIYSFGNAIYQGLPDQGGTDEDRDTFGHMFDTFQAMLERLRAMSEPCQIPQGYQDWDEKEERQVIYMGRDGVLLMNGTGADWLADGFEFWPWDSFK